MSVRPITIPTHRPYLGQEELDAVRQVFESRWLGMGAVTKEFEKHLGEFLGAPYVLTVNTGTAALHLALEVLDLQPGDEVIVPSLTFVSSVQAILAAGARPVFCEVSMETLTMDMEDVLRRVTSRTKAIMPVHYGGQACDLDRLLPWTKQQKIWVVEDAAPAFGSTYKGRKIGTLGDITCFSFDPIKNITCVGGGAVVTNNEEIARITLTWRNVGIDSDSWTRFHGEQNWRYAVVSPGYRYQMGNLNAAIGLVQLQRFEAFRARKQAIVRMYDEAFRELNELALVTRNLEETFPFSYVVRVLNQRRDALMAYLRNRGIGTSVHFVPNHLQPRFSDFRAQLPVTEKLFAEVLTLPLYFEMTNAEVETVIRGVHTFFQGASAGE
jgi:perosamine synthetase